MQCAATTHYWEIEDKDVIVIPSLSLNAHELQNISGVGHYEAERMLYVLLALGKSRTRVIYVTSSPLDHGIADYYVGLLPSEIRQDARGRVTFMSVCDVDTGRSLAEKICMRPRLLNRLRSMVRPETTVLNVLRGTRHEMRISNELGIPVYSARPGDQSYGSKSGSRALFDRLRIPCADGTSVACFDVEDLITQILEVTLRNPTAMRGVVKLDEGFSGKGNAVMDLGRIRRVDVTDIARLRLAARGALENMDFCCRGRTWDDYEDEIRRMGAIFELFVEGEITASPSVQVVVNEDYSVSVVSTHEQILDNQVYVGCRFPADEAYRRELMRYGKLVGEFFAERRITDHFSVDFICVRHPTSFAWEVYAIEINLRVTGTTHPWMTLKLLTHGSTDETSGVYYSDTHQVRCYVSSDCIQGESLRHLVPMDIKEIFEARKDLNWCPERQMGVVCHLLGCVSENGKIGMTSIADTPEGAQRQFDQAVSFLLSESDSSSALVTPPRHLSD
ncbi:hypothetical protein ACHAXA_001277 [Cyclostephanos tholiformis]|uniref:ATP-grasp domain-containing protein n=1 Tax=Cyclostephanos tholiformis TaxID=382380 RepID=A0ABD3R935_9STRA